jgi:hypothetical protein
MISKQKRELEQIDLLAPDVAKRRTDDLLRRMLNKPPKPFTPKKAKPKRVKRAK